MGNRGNGASAMADVQVAVVAEADAVDDGDGSQGNDVPEAEPDVGECEDRDDEVRQDQGHGAALAAAR